MFRHTEQSADLRAFGPVILMEIAAPEVFRNFRRMRHMRVPSPVKCNVLIDTGSTATIVSERLLRQLDLAPHDETDIYGINSTKPHALRSYYVDVTLVGHNSTFAIPNHLVAGADFDSHAFVGIIGRNVLALGEFTYSGTKNCWSFSAEPIIKKP